MSSLQKQILRNKLPPFPVGNTGTSGAGARRLGRKRDYTPASWERYFDSCKDVEIPDGSSFRVYLKGSSGPVVFMLHGGGYSGLTWSLFSNNICELVECQVAAVDLRGHGETVCTDEDDLSAERLSRDVGEVFIALYGDEPPSVILIGHSMGGAVAVHTVYQNLIPSTVGLVVIDVVEGTAMDALQSMQSFLRSRPPSFSSLQNAIEWCVRSGQVRNVESAKVSMPGQLKNGTNNLPATREVHLVSATDADSSALPTPRKFLVEPSASDSILEEAEEDEEKKNNNTSNGKGTIEQNSSAETSESSSLGSHEFKHPALSNSNTSRYVWRINLSKTEKFWTGWFEGLSNMFLASSIPKLLLLAGVDRLDRDLTIGQMQGKFQMQVLPQCGHAVHEDVPDKVADAVATFMVRNKFAEQISDFQRPFCGC